MVINKIKTWSKNNSYKKHFLQGYYIDPKLCDNIVDKFKIVHKNKQTSCMDEPRNYILCDLQSKIGHPLSSLYLENIYECLDLYYKTYDNLPSIGRTLYKYVNVQYFLPNTSYSKFHAERGSVASAYRHMVFITYLNDVKEGGETVFYFQNIKVKPEKGLTIFWPTEWTHTHRGLPTKEEKYIATGWFEIDAS